MPGNLTSSNRFCLECGLCCNGVIFADVQLKDGDDAEKLRSLGLVLSEKKNSKSETRTFVQPCAAFVNGCCGIYADRPDHCRHFQCLLLKEVQAGRTKPAVARRIVRETIEQVEKVRRLLREMGDEHENLPLGKRFRRVKRQVESGILDDDTAELFGRLTLAVHDLNLRLSGSFYPGT